MVLLGSKELLPGHAIFTLKLSKPDAHIPGRMLIAPDHISCGLGDPITEQEEKIQAAAGRHWLGDMKERPALADISRESPDRKT